MRLHFLRRQSDLNFSEASWSILHLGPNAREMNLVRQHINDKPQSLILYYLVINP